MSLKPMPIAGYTATGLSNSPLWGVRLQTQVLLRWMAVIGQLIAVILVDTILDYPVPLGLCFAAISASAWLNVILTIRYRATIRLPENQAAIYFGYDLLQLAVLLYLTGGLQNPFALLFLVPVTISATSLTLRSTIILWAVAAIAVTVLAFYHEPLPWAIGGEFQTPLIYTMGMWASLELGLGFMAGYAWRIAQESRRMSDALTATQLVLGREQRLSALDGLAAAAAHELGTPLGTIALVSKELQREFDDDSPWQEDLKLLRSQADRCKEILSRLTFQPEEGDAHFAQIPLSALLDEVVTPYRGGEVKFEIELTAQEESSEPVFVRQPEILYGLNNIVENATDFARTTVRLSATYTETMLQVSIIDDGAGFPPDVIDKLGEPYLTTRPRQQKHLAAADGDDLHEGMGLGFFIAKTFIERSGGTLNMANRHDGETGAVVTVTWPRTAIEASH